MLPQPGSLLTLSLHQAPNMNNNTTTTRTTVIVNGTKLIMVTQTLPSGSTFSWYEKA